MEISGVLSKDKLSLYSQKAYMGPPKSFGEAVMLHHTQFCLGRMSLWATLQFTLANDVVC